MPKKTTQEPNVKEIADVGRNAGYAAAIMSNKSDTKAQKSDLIRNAKAMAAAQLAIGDKVHAPDLPMTEKASKGKSKSHTERAKASKSSGQGELNL